MSRRRVSWTRKLLLRLGVLLEGVRRDVDLATLPEFANAPARLRIDTPRRIHNAGSITIGDDVSLGPGCLLHAICKYPGGFTASGRGAEPREYTPAIRIGHRVSATARLTVGAVKSVTIEDDVLIASGVFISDNLHGMERVDLPYKYQPLAGIAPVVIGRGSWIGENVVILPGVHVGDMCVVGANSVVRESVPPRSVAVGAPARVVRRWDDVAGAWERVD